MGRPPSFPSRGGNGRDCLLSPANMVKYSVHIAASQHLSCMVLENALCRPAYPECTQSMHSLAEHLPRVPVLCLKLSQGSSRSFSTAPVGAARRGAARRYTYCTFMDAVDHDWGGGSCMNVCACDDPARRLEGDLGHLLTPAALPLGRRAAGWPTT